MHLLLAAWGIDEASGARLGPALEAAAAAHPQLDAGTTWHARSGRASVAGVHHPVAALGPRRYVARGTGAGVVAYDGLPYAGGRDFDARDAVQLAERWDALHEAVEGQLAAFRLTSTGDLEVLTDPLGLAQLYVARLGAGWVLSTSARLLATLTGRTDLDPEAGAQLLAMGFVGGARTWHAGVEVLPGAQRWRWRGDEVEPLRETYHSARPLAAGRRRGQRVDVAALAEQLAAGPLDLAGPFAPFEAALTGGRDSRVVAGLLRRHDLEARYYTYGTQDAPDVVIAAALAEHLGLDHEHRVEGGGRVPERWEAASRRLVLQNDGLISLRHIATAVDQPERVSSLPVRLWGAGGGIAKGNWMSARTFLRPPAPGALAGQMALRIMPDHGGLVRPEARALARAHLRRFVDGALADGVPTLDVPALYSLEERNRRFDANVARMFRPQLDVFSPFASRPFVEAAFALSALQRWSSPLHHELSRMLAPGLHDVPYDTPWRSQRRGWNVVAGVAAARIDQRRSRRRAPRPAAPGWRQQLRAPWLEASLASVRSLCLDQAGSVLWDLADRSTFEWVMAASTPPEERLRRLDGLLDLATGFAYERALAESPVPSGTREPTIRTS